MPVEIPGGSEMTGEMPIDRDYESKFRAALSDARIEIAKLSEQELGVQLNADRATYLSSISSMERTSDQLVEERSREAETVRRLQGSDESPTKLLPIREHIRSLEIQLAQQDKERSAAHTRLAINGITAGLFPSATQLTLADFRYVAESKGRYLGEAEALDGAGTERLLPMLARLRSIAPDDLIAELDDIAVENARLTINDQGHDKRNDMTRVVCAISLLQKGVDTRADFFPKENKPHEEAWEVPDRN